MSISITATASRTSGAAPLGVSFHAVGTTSSNYSNPFQKLHYEYDYGDPGSGTFTQGRESGLSQNSTLSPIGGHVYKTAGTFRPMLTVRDLRSGDVEVYEFPAITVTAEDASWPTTQTIVVSDTDFTGKPDGATEVATDDFDVAMASFTSGKRILFRAGRTFNVSAQTLKSAISAASYIGAFGAGAKPIIQGATDVDTLRFTNATAAVNDVRIVGLNFVGQGVGDNGVAIAFASGDGVSKFTILDCDASLCGNLITIGGGLSSPCATEMFVQECTATDFNFLGFFGRLQDSAVLGTLFGPISADPLAEHCFRIQQGVRVLVQSNTATTPNADKHAFTLRASEYVDDTDVSRHVAIVDNKWIAGALPAVLVSIAPASTTQNHHIEDVIDERNWYVAGAAQQVAATVHCVRFMARNNIIDLTGATAHIGYRVRNENTAGAPVPDDLWFYNNSAFSNDTSNNYRQFWIGLTGETIGSTFIFNNLGYAPNDSVHRMVFVGSVNADTPTEGSNSSDAEILSTNPFSVAVPSDPTAGDFNPNGAHGAADSSIETIDDYEGNYRVSADMGAVALATGAYPDAETEEEPPSRAHSGKRKRRYRLIGDFSKLTGRVQQEAKAVAKEKAALRILIKQSERKDGPIYGVVLNQRIEKLEAKIDNRLQKINELKALIAQKLAEHESDDDEVMSLIQ